MAIRANASPEFVLSRDVKTRDRLMGLQRVRSSGGIKRFANLTAAVLRRLVALRFADPADRQNDAPSLGAFLELMERYPAVTAHGYAVDLARPDYRVTVEGVECDLNAVPLEARAALAAAFWRLCAGASSTRQSRSRLYAWWD